MRAVVTGGRGSQNKYGDMRVDTTRASNNRQRTDYDQRAQRGGGAIHESTSTSTRTTRSGPTSRRHQKAPTPTQYNNGRFTLQRSITRTATASPRQASIYSLHILDSWTHKSTPTWTPRRLAVTERARRTIWSQVSRWALRSRAFGYFRASQHIG